MSAADPYIKVRRAIVDDPRFATVYADAALLGWWLKLHLAADAAWPASAELPAACPAAAVGKLVSAGLLLLMPDGERFRLPDYDLEREGRAGRGRAGGSARGATAERGERGRFQRSKPATSVRDQRRDQRPDPASSSSVATSVTVQPLNATQLNAAQLSAAHDQRPGPATATSVPVQRPRPANAGNGHDEKWESDRREAVAGIRADLLTGEIAADLRRLFGITDAELAPLDTGPDAGPTPATP